MISLRTNLSSIITQQSLGNTTNRLNLAIERMSTGYKINHASDNAAGYSILADMNTQISACDVATNNIAMGMDLLSVAQDTVSEMQNKASKLHALITQARNGTYGADSLNSINLEAGAIIAEINRLYNSAEYDGIGMIKKFQPEIPESMQTNGTLNGMTLEECAAAHNGFIREVDAVTPEIVVNTAADLEDAINNNSIIGIANASVLAELAKIVNGTDGYARNNCDGKTICLTNDIDLSGYNWIPIGGQNLGWGFSGDFNGNGHTIKNLYSSYSGNLSGIFSQISGSTIKNLGVEGKIEGTSGDMGGIAGGAYDSSTIDNCWTDVEINNSSRSYNRSAAGIVCNTHLTTVANCYSKGNISAKGSAGGIIGGANEGHVYNCFSTGNITSTDNGNAGGIAAGLWRGEIGNSYSTGNITGHGYVGGISGDANDATDARVLVIRNSYSTGNIKGIGENSCAGGCVGYLCNRKIQNCYFTGNVEGVNFVGGIAGKIGIKGIINGAISTGSVSGSNFVGGAIGSVESVTINNSGVINISNTEAYGSVNGTNGETTGAFIGRIVNTKDGTNFTAVNFSGCQTLDKSHEYAGGVYRLDTSSSTYNKIEYDLSDVDIDTVAAPATRVTLQVGTYGNEDSQISFDVGFNYNLKEIIKNGCESDRAYNVVNGFINTLSEKATELGGVANRLESALNTVEVTMDNLVSSRSTLRDADIGELSSTYIRQQILQQAAATLMSTANQSPAIALQLI